MKEKKHLKEIKSIMKERKQLQQKQEEEKEIKRNQIIGNYSTPTFIDRISKIKEGRETSKQRMRDWSQKKPQYEPLYLKKEKEFSQQEQELDNLKREQELENRKNIFKRISLSEIRKHAKEHDNKLEDNLSVLRNRRLDMIGRSHDARDRISDQSPRSHNSKYLQNHIKQEKIQKMINEAKMNEGKEKRDKANRFAKIVQEIYWSKEKKEAEKKVKKDMESRKRAQNTKLPPPERPKVENYLHHFSQHNFGSKKLSKKKLRVNKSQSRLQDPSVSSTSGLPKPPLHDYLKEKRAEREKEVLIY